MSRQVKRPRHVPPPAPAGVGIPWAVVAIAAAGLVVSGVLAWSRWAAAPVPLCTEGTGCDIVQASRWAMLLGVPTAFWGALVFAGVGGLALRGLETPQRWLAAFVLAVAAVAFSAYLTGISLLVIGAACVWCLTNAALTVALLVAVLAVRPAGGRRSWVRAPRLPIAGALTAAATLIAAAGLFVEPVGGTPEYRLALARHLRAVDAVMYGAYWCPACAQQKARFGEAAAELPYVECDARGVRARPDLCERAGVRSYPTWVIGEARHEGVLSVEDLARISRFTGPAAAPAR
jgi:uncharacterized membrane protein